MKRFLFLLISVLIVACENNNSENKTEDNPSVEGTETPIDSSTTTAEATSTMVDTIVTPAGLIKLGETMGDLDKDGKAEKAFVFDTKRNTDFGTEREIHIFKLNDNKWELWHKSIGAVMPSENGGMMGDPFQEIKIENNCIVINHFGGSRYKWTYTHRYRFQNDAWKLIGATVNNGTPCEYWDNYDYNLSTGKIKYERETENCEESEDNPKIKKTSKDFTNKLKELPNMDGFHPGENEVKLAKMEEGFYY